MIVKSGFEGFYKSTLAYKFVIFFSCFFLSGCAGVLPVPGGNETVNHSFYESGEAMKIKFLNLKEGMTKQDVFKNLNRSEDELTRLSREEILCGFIWK